MNSHTQAVQRAREVLDKYEDFVNNSSLCHCDKCTLAYVDIEVVELARAVIEMAELEAQLTTARKLLMARFLKETQE
jgi:hypothetical protein